MDDRRTVRTAQKSAGAGRAEFGAEGRDPHALAHTTDRETGYAAARRSRGRALAAGIASSLAGKAIGLAAPLLITPLAFGHLGAERYGMWMAITSLTSMALFADFGLGNGLVTRLARLFATADRSGAAREISSAYALLGSIAAVLIGVLTATVQVVPWPALLNVTDPTVARDARAVVLICFGSFLVNIPLALIQRVQYAHQQVAQSNLWQAAGSLLSAALVFAGVVAHIEPVLLIAAAVLAVPLMNAANTICYFVWQSPDLRPSPRRVRTPAARGLLRLGLRFFVISVLSSIVLNIDGFLVGRVLGLTAAANYVVVTRVFSVLALFVTLVNLPLWPANGEALARGDVAWVRINTRRMSVLSAAVVSVPSVGLVLFGNDVLAFWIRSDEFTHVPVSLLAALAAYSVVIAMVSPIFMVQNSIGLLRPQFVGWSACLIVAIPLKVVLADQIGLAGVAVASVVSYAVTVLPAAIVGYHRTLDAASMPEAASTRGHRYSPKGRLVTR
ncbi:lipopolysaccharide biosynthesis protein [Micromonospora krabiensis]|uniref:Membrane protein involved in the export of O-antigen and teichoic acid n=1 Tax=Micromonospora krabiensis TaxID=307121 RepID=A0A1C3N2L2_9ACTN|nr:oligosaccharide flippase family protein [Micromonospora krabiensis]SBV26809.1 Membrane protein involved in the export of O-antigen and teichoic acid [Micromonospora krabiensis]